MTENLTSRPKLPGSLAASLRRNVSTPAIQTRSLPSVPVSNPVKQPVAQTASAPRVTMTTRSVSLPAVPVQNARPVIAETQPAASPVMEPKVTSNRSASAKKRNRGSVITPRDMALLKFLGKVNFATAELLSLALSDFTNKDVKTGEWKPASVAGINSRLTVLRKDGLVDYKNNRNGTTIWYPLWNGYEVIDKPFPDNRPRHQRRTEPPRPQKERVAPKESKWAHTLGLAALTIQFLEYGCEIITDDEMLSASEELRALKKNSNGYVRDKDISEDLSFKEPDQFRWSADHFTFPNEEGGSHRPDLVVMNPEYGVIAVELELHRKNIKALKWIFIGYALAMMAGRFDSVRYFRPTDIAAFLKRVLDECASRYPNLREFFEKISFEDYDAVEWKADVPEK